MQKAYAAMDALEKGAIANPDEKRMVGHYWLRAPELRADAGDRRGDPRHAGARSRRSRPTSTPGEIKPPRAATFTQAARRSASAARRSGPQFVADALGSPAATGCSRYFFDNTDPDGFDRVLAQLDGQLDETLVVVISQDRRHQRDAQRHARGRRRLRSAGLDFGAHAVAVTGAGSELDKHAQ